MSDEKTVSVAYRPSAGDPDTTEAYGRRFEAGEFIDIPEEFAERARNNPSFEVQGEKTYGDKEHDEHLIVPDDPDFPKDAGTEADISFDDAVALERMKEYGTDDAELAERLRAARQHNRDLAGVTRIEAEAAIKRKPGRPRKVADETADAEAKARAEEVERDRQQMEAEQRAEADRSVPRAKAPA